MHEFLAKALNGIIIVFLVSTMLSVGLSLTLRQILEPLRNVRLVISSMAVSYILVPLIAIVITRVIPLEEPLQVGLVLMSMAAGSEVGPKLTGIAKGNIAFSVGLLAAQLSVTIIYLPLVLSALRPEVQFAHGKLLFKLFATVLVPMALGMFLKARHGAIAERLSPLMHSTSTVFMLLLVVVVVVLNHAEILRLVGSGAILAGAAFVVFSFIVGHLFGGPGQDTRRTLGFMSGARNASISFMIASQLFGDSKVLLMIIVTTILFLLILLPTAFVFRRRAIQ